MLNYAGAERLVDILLSVMARPRLLIRTFQAERNFFRMQRWTSLAVPTGRPARPAALFGRKGRRLIRWTPKIEPEKRVDSPVEVFDQRPQGADEAPPAAQSAVYG
jgi:hypothetical protein